MTTGNDVRSAGGTDRTVLTDVDPSTTYLLGRLAVLEGRVRSLVARRRSGDTSPDDPFRGLYLSDEHIDQVLAGGAAPEVLAWDDGQAVASLDAAAEEQERAGTTIRLRSLGGRAGLDGLDLDLMLLALAPDLDIRFERIYGYLNDDVTRRRATVALALELAGATPWVEDARSRLSPDGPLVSSGLVLVEEADRPFLSRSLRIPDRVALYLLGSDVPDPAIADFLVAPARTAAGPLISSLAGMLAEGVALVYLQEKAGSSAASVGAAALEQSGRAAVTVDLTHLGPDYDISDVTRLIRREALLQGAGVVAGPVEALAERNGASLRALTAEEGTVVPLILHGKRGWEPGWSRRVPLVAAVEPGSESERLALWRESLGEDSSAGLVSAELNGQFLLSADQVDRAVQQARLQARLDGQDVTAGHLRSGARAQNGAGLERLARRIHPAVSWDDLVLAPPAEQALRALAARARQRGRVLDEWGMRPGGGRGRGITVLFAGDSGTGKTMSAEVIAGDLGLDLYTVNLATVVDKYVGETEKNLERIFTEADGVNAVLLFDEADAIFGKRSEVRDANDRYANIEVAYLLQRMETFDGMAILATNLRANVDDAFARRLDLIIDFPTPDVGLRRALWERCLAPGVPRADDLDLDFCAASFELSGGNIRSAAITAAYLAADTGHRVTMADLVKAIEQEYRKLGRLVVPNEFGRYYSLLAS